MRIAFRCDASLQIGTGHVMRCAALAAALAARGHGCTFLCRDLPGNLIARLSDLGFATVALPAPQGPPPAATEAAPHAHWAGVSWQTDAAQTVAHLPADTDWLVLDHYAFDRFWEQAARPPGAKLLVLDDLADRPHDCDLLVDPNLGRTSADYDTLIPPLAERLIGPNHALLRPEFAATRKASLAARESRGYPLKHLLIFMGGADLPGATGRILGHLHEILVKDPSGISKLTVLMGPTAPATKTVRQVARNMPLPCTVLSDVSDMAARMIDADVAIGAIGGAAWERCAMGLPTLAVILAQNQHEGAMALGTAGAARVLGAYDDPALAENLATALRELSHSATLRTMSNAAAAITDGKGLARIVAALQAPFHVRPATLDDAPSVWHWRETLPPTAMTGGANPPLDQHLTWFAQALQSPDRRLFMAGGDTPFGHARLDFEPDRKSATVSILLAPDARGKGLGLRLLGQLDTCARHAGITTLDAHIHPDNAASLALFRAAGYHAATTHLPFTLMRRTP